MHRFDPDIVLCVFFVGNDLSDNCSRLGTQPRIYYDLDEAGNLYQVPFSANRARLSAWLNRHSRFYVWQKDLCRKARNNFSTKIGRLGNGDWGFCSQEPDDVAHAWRITGELIRVSRREVEGRGNRFAVVMLPSAQEVYGDCFQNMAKSAGELAESFAPDHPQKRLGTLCREAGVPLFSLADDFRQAAPSASIAVEQEHLYNGGVWHLNDGVRAVPPIGPIPFLACAGPATPVFLAGGGNWS